MAWVRNLVTGMVHEVPAGHPALTDGQHELLPEERQEPAEATEPPPAEELAEAPAKPKKK